MATLSELTLYPIKSCAGIALSRAVLTHQGLMSASIYDREWMVVDAGGRFLTQREHPRMALIVPRLTAQTLELRAPGLPTLEIALDLSGRALAATLTVHIWDESFKAYDCDAATAAWFSSAVGAPCRLVRFHREARRLASASWTGGVEVPTLFSDGYPVLVAGAASLDEVNGRLVAAGRSAIPMNRFRPNLVIDGIGPFEEDYAESYRFGGTLLKPVKPCPRCPMPSVDQASGVVGPDPLDLMHGYRSKPEVGGAICFGMNSIVVEGGDEHLYLGQEVEVTLAF